MIRAARLGADWGSVRSASRAISVSATMFFFSTVTSSVRAWAKATTSCDCKTAMEVPAASAGRCMKLKLVRCRWDWCPDELIYAVAKSVRRVRDAIGGRRQDEERRRCNAAAHLLPQTGATLATSIKLGESNSAGARLARASPVAGCCGRVSGAGDPCEAL